MMLWLSLYLPRLAIEAVNRPEDSSLPFAIYGHRGAERFVVECNAAALHGGIRLGISLATAQAMAPALVVWPRDETLEQQALQHLAVALGQFTPSIHLADAQSVLLEVGGSLKLFGDIVSLQNAIAQLIQQFAYTGFYASAPTPYAAQWLARADPGKHILDLAALAAALSTLSIARLGWDPQLINQLHKIGIHTLGACTALPRPGLQQRFGKSFLDMLDQAYGQRADVRVYFKPPSRFKSAVALPAPVIESEALLFVLQRLLLELVGFLRLRDLCVQNLLIRLKHTKRRHTDIEVGFVKSTRDFVHLMTVCKEHLQRVQVPAEVTDMAVYATKLEPFEPEPLPLLDKTRPANNPVQIVEQLRARLGSNHIHGVQCAPDHRPERAWSAPLSVSASTAHPQTYPTRPIWLLPTPHPLTVENGCVQWHGPLTLLSGPERIESGWWDHLHVTRDYFIAVNTAGERLWIFRHPSNGIWEWYLHGLFA